MQRAEKLVFKWHVGDMWLFKWDLPRIFIFAFHTCCSFKLFHWPDQVLLFYYKHRHRRNLFWSRSKMMMHSPIILSFRHGWSQIAIWSTRVKTVSQNYRSCFLGTVIAAFVWKHAAIGTICPCFTILLDVCHVCQLFQAPTGSFFEDTPVDILQYRYYPSIRSSYDILPHRWNVISSLLISSIFICSYQTNTQSHNQLLHNNLATKI